MIISSEAIIQNLIVHRVHEGRLILAPDYNRVNGSLTSTLIKFLFKPFLKEERFHFDRPTENEVFQSAFKTFSNPDDLLNLSQVMAKRLFQFMGENKKDGEIIFCTFEDCVLDDEVTDAIGIFFMDRKRQFMTVNDQGNTSQLSFTNGQDKILKGIMIFNTDVENGYQCMVINKGTGGEDDPVWSSFLSVEKIKDNYFQTQQLIHNLQEFAQQTFEPEQSSDKIALINESIDYIKKNDFFEQDAYQDQVLQSPELIEKFNSFTEEKSLEEPSIQTDHFEISKPAVKKSKRFIRSVIKLDKNFHVYVHGNRENIIKGYDDAKNKHFYTLYYEEEN